MLHLPHRTLGSLAFSAILCVVCQAKGEGQILEAAERAAVIRIVDEWSGLSPAAPQRASFELQLTDEGGYVGWGRYSVGPEGPDQLRDSAEVTIPAGAVNEFYATLGRIEGEPGTYEPRITHTDDFPRLVIELVWDAETVRLYSSSQGRGHVPWGLQRGGSEYVVDSALPFEALERLRPYLKMDRLQTLIEQRL